MQADDDVLERVSRCGVVPVVVLEDVAEAEPLGASLVAGGLPIAEVTFRTSAAAAAIAVLAEQPELLVGAGTVIRAAQVDEAVEAGARFIVSPGLSAGVVRRCEQLGVACLPGIASPTELMAALDLGLDTVKFFPAETIGGLPALKAFSAPFPGVRFVPTGGITVDTAPAYLDHPAVLAVGGSWMVPRDALGAGRWDEVTALAAAAAAIRGS